MPCFGYDKLDFTYKLHRRKAGMNRKGASNMKKCLLLILCLVLNFNVSYASDVAENKPNSTTVAVQKFKDAIKTGDPQIIAKYVVYPYKTRTPLPAIKNETDFIKNHDLILDDELKQVINDSKPENWASAGWRGIMLYEGLVWISADGKLEAVNYRTKKERDYAAKWYENDKNTIHESLRQYDKNIYIFNTDTKLGRIDEIETENGENYRLALWAKDEDMSDKPQVLVSDGTVKYFGSANNAEYYFKSGEYEYVFSVTKVGPMDMVPYELGIYKNAEKLDYSNPISTEEAYIIK